MKKSQNLIIQIDHRSTEKACIQIAKQLKTIILTHQYQNKLLDVDELAKFLNIDKQIVIDAFQILLEEQIISNDQGTYQISYQEITDINDQEVLSFADTIKMMNQKFSMKVFDESYQIADEKIVKTMSFVLGEVIYSHKRIYYGDSYPKAYMELYFSKELMPNVDQEPYIHMPYYQIISFNPDYVFPYKKVLKSVKFSDEINEMLSQSKDTSGFMSEEFYFDEHHQLTLYAKIYFNVNFFVRFKE